MRRSWNRGIERNIVRNFLRATPEDIDAGVHWYQNALSQAKLISFRYPLKHEWPLSVLGGDKVRAFFYNILFPLGDEVVTIDRHMKAIAVNAPSERKGFASSEKHSAVKKSEYDYLAWHYRIIAARYGLIPSQFQAISWTTWKRINENNQSGD